MTREEEIRKASNGYINTLELSKRDFEYCDIEDAFEAGAQWADTNSKFPWISVDEDLPYNHEELIITEYNKKYTYLVLVKTNQGIRPDYMRHFIDKGKDCWIWGGSNSGNCSYKVYYWLNIPSLKDIIEVQGKILKFLKDSYNPNHYFIQLQ